MVLLVDGMVSVKYFNKVLPALIQAKVLRKEAQEFQSITRGYFEENCKIIPECPKMLKVIGNKSDETTNHSQG